MCISPTVGRSTFRFPRIPHARVLLLVYVSATLAVWSAAQTIHWINFLLYHFVEPRFVLVRVVCSLSMPVVARYLYL